MKKLLPTTTGAETATQPSHRIPSRSSLLRLMWIISTLRPEQLAAVGMFVEHLVRNGGGR